MGDWLKRAAVTVYHHNRQANRYSIGCSGIIEQPKKTVKTRIWRPWKKKLVRSGYCSLHLFEKKGETRVQAYDRNGIEAPADELFDRLLAN
jgi:hypothetical protein